MKAHDRPLPEWFEKIRKRELTLPRFQRMVAWDQSRVQGLLTTVLRGLPSGATLILHVGDEEKFVSRTMTDAPTDGDRVTEQLLDGQQRLTALWRALNDTFDDRTYLVGYGDEDGDGIDEPFAFGQPRWPRNGSLYPLWVDDPRECWKRRLVPVRLLLPGDVGENVDDWIDQALGDLPVGERYEAAKPIRNQINELRTRVREFNLPYLALPASTPTHVALEVFIKMNTSSVKLSVFDIVVAEVEERTGKSLHDHVEEVRESVPRAQEYADVNGLVLDIGTLLQDRRPNQVGYNRMDIDRFMADWPKLVSGLRFAVNTLEGEAVFDAARLPTYQVIPVLAALADAIPTSPDALGNARTLLSRYIWRAFLTTRYDRAASTAALQDYRALRDAITGDGDPYAAPIFDENEYPLPTVEQIQRADWPAKKSILARGLLCLQLRAGAEDVADGRPATVETITRADKPREYHHLFPASLLDKAGLPAEKINRVVNCALITWRTNRTISAKDPIAYIKERIDRADGGDEVVHARLATHLIPVDQLMVGGYAQLDDAERAATVEADYESFVAARAELLEIAARERAGVLTPVG